MPVACGAPPAECGSLPPAPPAAHRHCPILLQPGRPWSCRQRWMRCNCRCKAARRACPASACPPAPTAHLRSWWRGCRCVCCTITKVRLHAHMCWLNMQTGNVQHQTAGLRVSPVAHLLSATYCHMQNSSQRSRSPQRTCFSRQPPRSEWPAAVQRSSSCWPPRVKPWFTDSASIVITSRPTFLLWAVTALW